MEESSTLKLIIEKGPRRGETLEYPSATVVKIGRVVRGNTIGIKDAGISSKHICIQFDPELRRWTLSDLDSSNGTILNGQILKPYVPAGLKDGDCIKIGELTSILVKTGVEATILSESKLRQQGKYGAGAAAAVFGSERSGLGLGLGFDGDLAKTAVEAPVEKRNLRSRAKKAVDLKNEVDSSSSKRTLRSSRKEKKVSFIPTLNEIPEDLNLEEIKATNLIVPVEGKKKRGRKRKLPVQLPQEPDIVVPVDGKKTRIGRKGLSVNLLENVQNNGLEENASKAEESVRVDAAEQPKSTQGAHEAKALTCDQYPADSLEIVESSGLEGNLDATNESAQDLVAEKLVLMQEGCEGKEAIVDTTLLKGLSEVANQVHVDKGKEVAEEVECRQSGCEDLVKNIGSESSQRLDLEKITLGEYFDCLIVQLPKEIREKSEKILSHLKENARKCHEFRLQRNENGEDKPAMG